MTACIPAAAPLPCHLIPTPSGRFAFAGRVPKDLAFAASNPDYIATALQCGPGIAQKQAAREGGTFRSLSWATEADAYAYAAGLGYAVPARPVYHPQTLSALRLYQGAAKARCRRIDDAEADADYEGAAAFAASTPGARDPVMVTRIRARERCGELLAKVRAIRATMRNGYWQGDNGPLDLARLQESLWLQREDRRAFVAAAARATAGAPCEPTGEASEAGQVTDTVTLPTHWAGFLINGDATDLDDGEEDLISAHLKVALPDAAAIVDVVEGSERFTWSYRLYGGDASGGDVADYTVLRPGARAAVQRAGAAA